MSRSVGLTDSQWGSILDKMERQSSQQPHGSVPSHISITPVHAGDEGIGDFTALNFNPTVPTLDQDQHYSGDSGLFNFGSHSTTSESISLANIRRISSELEGVKERLERRSKQIDALLQNMNRVFAHLAAIQPFLNDTQNMLKEVVSRADMSFDLDQPQSHEAVESLEHLTGLSPNAHTQ